ncbi:MAG: hypothetical protein AAFY29_10585 [Pseudomonadota bacterium]
MRGLAAYAMDGRARAMIIAIASSSSLLFAWIGAAVVALVVLRKGVAEGAHLLLWASLPATVWAWATGDSTVIALMLGTGTLALVLRLSMSLTLAALGSAVVALLTGVGVAIIGDAMIDDLDRMFSEVAAAMEAQGENAAALLPSPSKMLLAGMLGSVNGLLAFLCLALGRYWQAVLYNPGGFGEEFRALRFPPSMVLGLGACAAALMATGIDWRSWALMPLLPLTVGGFALLHARANRWRQSGVWMGLIYLVWLIWYPARLALLALVLADAMMDFRSRWDDDDDPRAGSGSGESKRGAGLVDRRDDAREGDDQHQNSNDEKRDAGLYDGRDDSDPRP